MILLKNGTKWFLLQLTQNQMRGMQSQYALPIVQDEETCHWETTSSDAVQFVLVYCASLKVRTVEIQPDTDMRMEALGVLQSKLEVVRVSNVLDPTTKVILKSALREAMREVEEL